MQSSSNGSISPPVQACALGWSAEHIESPLVSLGAPASAVGSPVSVCAPRACPSAGPDEGGALQATTSASHGMASVGAPSFEMGRNRGDMG
jgi:hypothetical protein